MAPTAEHPLYPVAVILPIFALLTFLLDTPPLIWHIRNRNLAAASLVAWIMMLNFFSFINALIWPTDDRDNWWDGTGLCDVEARVFVGSGVALPGALACIMRGLASVLDTNAAVLVPSKAQRRRQLATDICFCFVFPALQMAVYYIAQPMRYYIFGISGCDWGLDNSWVGVIVAYIWPPILSLVDLYYAVLVVARLLKYRREFARLLEHSNTSKSRFVRLFSMAMVLIVGTCPVQFYVFASNLAIPYHPFSWESVHGSSWDEIVKAPGFGAVHFDRWIRLAGGFVVFVFFGMGTDASKMYKAWTVKLGLARIFPCLGDNRKQSTSDNGAPHFPSTGFRKAIKSLSISIDLSVLSKNRSSIEDSKRSAELDSAQRMSISDRNSQNVSEPSSVLPLAGVIGTEALLHSRAIAEQKPPNALSFRDPHATGISVPSPK